MNGPYPVLCIKYSLDRRHTITTASDADWLRNYHQHKWLQAVICF